MPTAVNIKEFLKLSEQFPILDVRSPGEFEYGHIPDALSLPLFSNEERAIVGTAYKQVSRESAVNKGLEIFGPKMKTFAEEAKKISSGNTFLVHCWRGGMRSGTVAWLLELYGCKVYLLRGGYKSFRRIALESFATDRKILVLGGKTGSGKTLILKKISESGEQVIDLEKLAHHKGSSFGALGEKPQPSQEMFENQLFTGLYKTDPARTIWVENESSMIGTKVIPKLFFEKMKSSPLFFLDIPFEERLDFLTSEYGKFNPDDLKDAITRITRKLGGLNAQIAATAIDNGDIRAAFNICLTYYDKTYDYGKNKRLPETITNYCFETLNADLIAKEIIENSKQSGL
ncbi:MAG: tRNA 2-selenouridine(34) synthase MnmH [Bacteroidota bacterium]